MAKRHLTAIFILFFAALLAARQFPTGVFKPSEEEKAKSLAAFREYSLSQDASEKAEVRSGVPASHVNIAHLPVVGNQGSMGICGSFAPTYYLGNYYLSLHKGDERYNPKTDSAKMVSPMWAVHMFRHGVAGSQPYGGDSVDSIRGLCEQGYLTLAEMPFDGAPLSVYYLPTAEIQLKALKRRFGGYGVRLSDITTQEGLEKLKAALRNGDIFVAGTAPITLNFDQYPTENAVLSDNGLLCNNNGVFAWPCTTGTVREGHAVTIIGYDDNKRYINKDGEEAFGALLAVNSWGTGWGVKYEGEGGYIWFGYESFQKYGFLGGECYSLKIGEGSYAPSMTATVLVEGKAEGDNPWIDKSVFRQWLHNLNFTLNGHTLDNPVPANNYLTGMEENPQLAEVLVDLSGYEDISFPQLEMMLSFGNSKKLGEIRSLEVKDGDGEVLWDRVTDGMELKPYSGAYPSCSHYIGVFEETGVKLPPIYPNNASFALGDLNGDGRLDAVASVRQGQAVESAGCEFLTCVFLQKKDGTWQTQNLELDFLEHQSRDMLPVDLNNDGILDIAACDGGKAVFLQNDGKGNFTQLAAVTVGEVWNNCPGFMKTADFDNDGKPDFVLVNDEGTYIIRQETATKYTVYPVGKRLIRSVDSDRHGSALAVGDVNGDGWTDIVISGCIKDAWGDNLVLYVNQGDMTFAPYVLPQAVGDFCSIAVADSDGDGCDDILCSSRNQVLILKGRPDASGKVQLPLEAQLGPAVEPNYGGNVAWCDLDMDGQMEAVITGTTTGVTGSAGMISDPYGEDNTSFPMYQFARNYLKIFRWDGEQFVDSDMVLPGTVGFAGPSVLCLKDMDGDGKPDIVHGGCYGYKSVIYTHQGPNRAISGMTFLHNEFGSTPTAPSAPTDLAASALGKGQAQLSWKGTAARYVLRIGTASGKCDVLSPENGAFYRSGATLTHLPAMKLYWVVQAIDAAGNVSAWSKEGTFTPNGSASAPAPSSKYPAEIIALPEFTISCVSEDTSRGSVEAPGKMAFGQSATLTATPKAGWRFSCWTGDGYVADRLSSSTTAKVYGNTTLTAHFVPADDKLQIDEEHLGFQDAGNNLWFYEDPFRQVPAFAATTVTSLFALADGTAYFDRIGPRAWNQRLLRALDGTLWFNSGAPNFGGSDGMTGYVEQTQKAWGGPGGLVVRYNYETAGTNSYTKRGLAVVHAGYDSYPQAELRDKDEIAFCVPQKSFLLILMTTGRVRFLGVNDSGQFGAATPYHLKECTEIANLPKVTAIAAGASFAAAIDMNGALWTWGDNRQGQLGRGTPGGRLPIPEKVAGLSSKVVAIAAGDNHLAALCEDGSLHLWGDNSFGQLGATNGLPLAGKNVKAVAAAANRTAALVDGVIYLWGDGEKEPVAIDKIGFDTVQCELKVDDRAASLLSETAGNLVARANVPITLQADSAEKALFQHWIVDGVKHTENPLTVTLASNSVIEAVYQLMRPLVTFAAPVMTDSEIQVDLMMYQTEQQFDGAYFALTHSANMTLRELRFKWPTPRGTVRFDNADDAVGTRTTEFYLYNTDWLFRASDATSYVQPICTIVFDKPTKGTEAFAEWKCAPVFSREKGTYSDEADVGERLQIALDNTDEALDDELVAVCVIDIPEPGRFGYLCIPGDADVRTLADLEALLGVVGLRAWSWEDGRMKAIDEILPQQTMLFSVGSKLSDNARIYYQPTAMPELKPGWNLVMRPQETPLPPEVEEGYGLDKACNVFVKQGGRLQPGKPYWLYVK